MHPEHQRVHPLTHHRLQDRSEFRLCLRALFEPLLDDRRQPGRRSGQDGDSVGVTIDNAGESSPWNVAVVAITPMMPLRDWRAAGLTAGSMPMKGTSG